jgi:serine/threonine protein kinase
LAVHLGIDASQAVQEAEVKWFALAEEANPRNVTALVRLNGEQYIVKIANEILEERTKNQQAILQMLAPEAARGEAPRIILAGRVINDDVRERANETFNQYDYIITNYFEGDTLFHILNERGPFSVREALDITFKLARRVRSLHRRGGNERTHGDDPRRSPSRC